MLFHRVSLLTLSLVVGLNVQAQIIILPDNSTTIPETSDDSVKEVPSSPINTDEPNPSPETQSVSTPASKKSPKSAPVRKKSTQDSFVLGFDMRQYKYEEPDLVTHQGLMFGATAKYLLVYQSGELNFNTEMLYGQLNYDGSITKSDGMGGSTVEPIQVTNTDFFSKTNALWQWTPLGPGSPLLLKIGLGLRFLSDNYTDSGFYQRTGLWGYVPLGVEVRSKFNRDTQVSFGLMYQQIVYGGINSKLSELGINGLDDIYFKQNGHGLELEAGVIYKKTYHIAAYFEGWYMSDSDIASAPALGTSATLQEPENSAISYGIRLGYDLF